MFSKKPKMKAGPFHGEEVVPMPITIRVDYEMLKLLGSVDGKSFLEQFNAFRKTIIELIVDYWRITKMMSRATADTLPLEIREQLMRFEDTMKKNNFEIKDMTNKPYSEGMVVDVIHFEKSSDASLGSPTISETLRPTIYFKGQVIEKGEIIVTEPSTKEG